MAIYNNVAMPNIPLNTGNVSQVKKSDKTSDVNEIPVVSKKTNPDEFSLVLSTQQQQSLNDSLGYDQPSSKERDALDAYRDVAMQEKRDQIIESMSFHFVV